MWIFKSRDHLFDRIERYADIRQFHFKSFPTCYGAQVHALSDSRVNSIITVTVESIASALKSQRRYVGIYSVQKLGL